MKISNALMAALAFIVFFFGELSIAFSQPSEISTPTLVDDPGYRAIHEKTSAIHGKIAIYTKQDTESEKWYVRVQYIKRNADADEVHLSDPMVLNERNTSELAFESLIDEATGVWCFYDTGNHNFVILVAPPNEQRHRQYDIWHPGVRGIGWGRGIWIDYFRKIRKVHDHIPYNSLPAELETLTAG